jgi:hypothetical protein
MDLRAGHRSRTNNRVADFHAARCGTDPDEDRGK